MKGIRLETMKQYLGLGLLSFLLSLTQSPAEVADHITQYGITWTFDKEYPVGHSPARPNDLALRITIE
jgi:hypothetical protein